MSQQLSLQHLDREKVELLKSTICKGSTDDELKLFIHACNHSGLDPFMRQIYAVKRWDSSAKRETMAIQVGIDGYRLIAERTGRYAPGPETTYTYDANGQLLSATAYVKKQTSDGSWHTVSATAFFQEYCQRNRDGAPVAMWKNMPHNMISKVAEALCLRKSFPYELSGIYTKEEMDQADTMTAQMPIDPPITAEQAHELELLMHGDEEGTKKLLAWANVAAFAEIKVSKFAGVQAACQRRAKLRLEEEMKQIESAQPAAQEEV